MRPSSAFSPVPLVLCLLLSSSCATLDPAPPAAPPGAPPADAGEAEPQEAGPRTFTILAVNDVYRIEGVDDGAYGGLARLRSLRAELEQEAPDLLLLHAGDFLFPSFISRWYSGRQMIDVMNLLDGDGQAFDPRMFVTFGNHEFDQDDLEDAGTLDLRVEESQFHWLGTNVDFLDRDDGSPSVAADHLLGSTLVDSGGVRVGLFSLSTDEKHPAYVRRFGDPEQVARRTTADLRRRGAEVVVALTHLSLSQDTDLLRRLGADGPDLLIGGHEHNKLCVEVDGRWVLKADAEARTATIARVTIGGGGPPRVDFEFRDLGPDLPTDPAVQQRVDHWVTVHGEGYCACLEMPIGCLEQRLAGTRVTLIGEELQIRRYETNLGNWIMDQALARFADLGVQAAFVNSGSLRLNQDIPADSHVTRRHVEEIFQYPSKLEILRVTGAVLQEAVSHSVTDWTGNGKWLQIAGFTFRHDPATATADHLALLTAGGGKRPIEPEEELLVVTSDFLAAGKDGYTMFTADQLVPYPGTAVTLRDLVTAGLEAAKEDGIEPRVEGRIYNTGSAVGDDHLDCKAAED